jgi:hypothetical protein
MPADVVIERMAEEGYLAGLALEENATGPLGTGAAHAGRLSDDGHGLLVAVTERRTRDEIDGYVAALEKVIQ